MMTENREENFDIELFIGEIKTYPEIWNIAAETYHDRRKKRGAWINICRVFCERFDEKNEKDKNEICNKFIQKWRNIKDHYTKSEKKKIKSGQGTNSRRRYVYARQLSFLQTAGATTDTQSNLDNKEDSVGHQKSHNSTSQLDGSDRQQPRFEQNSTKKRKRDMESSLIEFINTPIPTTQTIVPEINPDRSFFESIIPSISSFTEDQKLEFRCEILNIIKQIRNQPVVQPYGYLPNNPHYNPTHRSGPMYSSSNYFELNRPPRPNQCPISITQFQTPLSTQFSQTTNTEVHLPKVSPTSSSSTSMDNHSQLYDEDSMDLFRD